jgi:hypothetical protein
MAFKLVQKQEEAINLAMTGKNLFITGGAGVGKSYLLKKLVSKLGFKAVVCAPTGIAALNVGGVTIHSAFGMPLGIVTENDHRKVDKARKLFGNSAIKTLIIDEISMVRADLFAAIDKKLKIVRRNNLPFGGLQVIVVGDFFQLPPVLSSAERGMYNSLYDGLYSFQTDAWHNAGFQPIVLDEVIRQDDNITSKLLNLTRMGKVSDKLIGWLHENTSPSDTNGITLCSRRMDAELINNREFDKIDQPVHKKQCIISGKFSDSELPVPKVLELKESCRVMICANNQEEGYVNGHTGVVKKIGPTYIVVKIDDGPTVSITRYKWEKYSYKSAGGVVSKVPVARFEQYPLMLGYACTIHKAQGKTLSNYSIDIGYGAFCAGQTYVALSRMTDIKKIHLLTELVKGDFFVDSVVTQFYESLQ